MSREDRVEAMCVSFDGVLRAALTSELGVKGRSNKKGARWENQDIDYQTQTRAAMSAALGVVERHDLELIEDLGSDYHFNRIATALEGMEKILGAGFGGF